ncbi:IclR family transcriptional regulator [Metabacillus herbersteinensis]|uniref:IclR family transcriptional regulator n=1 Tax=Metabacillus herbersteinensis TaxID=283816 RepID=A0ABV6GHZ5_9BACI
MQSKNKTVVRSMDVLNLFLTHSRLSLSEMVQFSGMPKTSVYRMVTAFEEMGFLEKDEEGNYSLGLLFLQFGQLVSERLDIRQIALPVMQRLRDEVGEAVNLIVQDGEEAIYIEKLETKQAVGLFTKVGRRSPLYAGACSRIILAFLPNDEREDYLNRIELRPMASGTITDKTKLLPMLEESRKLGYTLSRSELADHTCAIAAPIFNNNGQIVAGISIAGINVNFQEEKLPLLIEKVKSAADELSQKLGYVEM